MDRRTKQIAACQQTPHYSGHTIDYIAAMEYFKHRERQGDRQVFCKTCQLWKYPTPAEGCDKDDVCEYAVTVPQGKCVEREQRRPAKGEALCRRCIAALEATDEGH